jgi:CHASE1-domain containing sensor protein
VGTSSGLSFPALRGWRWFAVVAATGLFFTSIVTVVVVVDQKASRQRILEAMGRDIQHRLGSFLLLDHGLRGTRAMVEAVGGIDVLTSNQFNVFVRSQEIGQKYPGTRGIGLARRVPVGTDAAALGSLKRKGWQLSRLWSLGPNFADRYIVIGAYPIETNFEAIGGDLASEPKRAATISRAMRTGQAQISAPIELLRSEDKVARGFLIE